MVKSMFAGVAGLRAHQTKMDVIGNNIANVNTYSFKAGRATFRDAFYQTLTAGNEAGGGLGGRNPSQIGYGSEIGNISVLYTRGAFAPTDSPSDMMIMGQGYFLVGSGSAGYPADGKIDATGAGLTNLNLTRVGMFEFDGKGNLVDPTGNMVYGFATTTAADGTVTVDPDTVIPIRLPTDAGAPPPAIGTAYTPIKLDNISFGADGTITGKADGKVYTVGKIAVANVPNQAALNMTQGSYYKAGANTGVVSAHVPGTGTTGAIRAGGLEMANVDLSKEFSDMITTQRGFQANTRIITVTDEMLQELVNLKR